MSTTCSCGSSSPRSGGPPGELWPRARGRPKVGALALGWPLSADHIGALGYGRLVMFVSGILLKEALDAGLGPRADLLGLPALAATVVAVLYGEAHHLGGEWRFGCLFVGFLILCLAAFGRDGFTARVLSWDPDTVAREHERLLLPGPRPDPERRLPSPRFARGGQGPGRCRLLTLPRPHVPVDARGVSRRLPPGREASGPGKAKAEEPPRPLTR